MNQGILPDLRYDTLSGQVYWVTAKEWWYTLEFDADIYPSHQSDLILDFVDGNAEIWLNGIRLSEMNNAFYPHQFHVKDIIKEHGNRLYIRFISINELLDGKRLNEQQGWYGRRSVIRKPQFNFGWDWALPVSGIGLAGDVWIENGNEYKFEELGIQTFMEGRADFNFEVSKSAAIANYVT